VGSYITGVYRGTLRLRYVVSFLSFMAVFTACSEVLPPFHFAATTINDYETRIRLSGGV